MLSYNSLLLLKQPTHTDVDGLPKRPILFKPRQCHHQLSQRSFLSIKKKKFKLLILGIIIFSYIPSVNEEDLKGNESKSVL